MSRVGKKLINIPVGVKASVDNNVFTASSSKGELKVPFSEKITVGVDGSTITIKPTVEEKNISALWGLTRSIIQNAVTGVDKGWEKVLEIYGVGYRALLNNNDIDLQVGQSHPVLISPPQGIKFEAAQEIVEGNNVQVIKVHGIDKQLVGDVAAKIRSVKPPEPYKGKGIRYRGEYVRRKAGKATG
ncbi:MAG: 50S ribosomal protein L6 [Candidatus Latescibacteria bacterium]|nr:50S ribosomal protein L6 [Candidatus Latescibacterota bacterium]